MFLKDAVCIFFILKTFKNLFWKTIDFVENLEMTQIAGGSKGKRRHGHVLCVIMTQCVGKSICGSPLTVRRVSTEFKLSLIRNFSYYLSRNSLILLYMTLLWWWLVACEAEYIIFISTKIVFLLFLSLFINIYESSGYFIFCGSKIISYALFCWFLRGVLRPCLTSMIKRFCENKQQFVAVNDFGEKALS